MAERILHVIPALARRYGGPSAATLGMCRALRALGASVLVAATDADGHGRMPMDTGIVTEYDDVPVIWFPRQVSESFKWSRPLAHWLGDHVTDFDLVHVHAVFSHSTMAAASACHRAGVPYIVRPLGTLDPWSLNHHRLRKRILLASGLRRALECATRIQYTASDEQQLAERALPWLPAGVVVPLGLEDAFFSDETSRTPRADVIVSLARLHPKKGIDVLISAFHALPPAVRRTWRLVIAGDGEPAYVKHLKTMATDGDSAGQIDFVGWLDLTRRIDLLRESRLLALPSHQENFGLAVAEAMAAGVAVMVTPAVNLAGAIAGARAGWVVERSVPAWTAALGDALPDAHELTERALAARRLAEEYRWPVVAERLRAMYGDAIAAHRAARAVARPSAPVASVVHGGRP